MSTSARSFTAEARLGIPSAAMVSETHVSTVFFAGDRAYKLLKPVDLGFVDFSTPEKRLHAARQELELNRRIAPDVYLGLADVVEGNRTADRFIVMRRMPEERRLAELLRHGGGAAELRQIAREIARFHAGLDPIRNEESTSSAKAVRGNWEDNVRAMIPLVGSVFDAADFGRVCSLYSKYIDGRERLFDERIASGQVRDGHGDLTAEDIFCLDDGPRILDCLAFSDALRISDVLCDVAFLAMDVERLTTPSRAEAFIDAYCEFSNEHHPRSLLHHYVAYRAHVRAKVAALRFQQGHADSSSEAGEYLQLCLRHLEAGTVRLTLVGGGPGSGKTTTSNRLAERYGGVALSSDELRKDLAGRAHTDRELAGFNEGIYSPEFTIATYTALLEQAETLLQSGTSVILDASWPTDELRRRARTVANDCSADIAEFELSLPAAECRERIAKRLKDPDRVDCSDARGDLVDQAMAARNAWPEAVVINGALHPDQIAESLGSAMQ